jgi:hypothetical protein
VTAAKRKLRHDDSWLMTRKNKGDTSLCSVD